MLAEVVCKACRFAGEVGFVGVVELVVPAERTPSMAGVWLSTVAAQVRQHTAVLQCWYVGLEEQKAARELVGLVVLAASMIYSSLLDGALMGSFGFLEAVLAVAVAVEIAGLVETEEAAVGFATAAGIEEVAVEAAEVAEAAAAAAAAVESADLEG